MRIVTFLTLLLLMSSLAHAESSLTSSEIVRNKFVVTIKEGVSRKNTSESTISLFRDALRERETENKIKSVNYLYSEFCQISSKTATTPQAAHLKLLNQGIESLGALDDTRIGKIKSYLVSPLENLCNQFVVTTGKIKAKKLADILIDFNQIPGVTVEDIQPIYRYRVAKSSVATLTDSGKRPLTIIAVISSPDLNLHFKGLRRKNKYEVVDNAIDDDENGYRDDIFGIHSREAELSFEHSTGFLTVAVAKDKGDFIEYTTTDAARALLYAIHSGASDVYIPFANDDLVLNNLAKTNTKLGAFVTQNISTIQEKIRQGEPRTAPIVNGDTTPVAGVGAIYSAIVNGVPPKVCTAVEIKERCILTALHCATTGYDTFYSPAATASADARGVTILRSATVVGEIPGDHTGPTIAFSDLAVMYTSKNSCRFNEGQTCYYSGTPANWSPKQMGKAALGDVVKAVGYAPDPRSLVQFQRSGKFKINYVGKSPIADLFYYQASPLLANVSVGVGDSGGPLLKGDTLVGITSSGQPTRVNFTGFSNLTKAWVEKKKAQVCRKIGSLSLVLKSDDTTPINTPGFKISMTSSDPLGVLDLNDTKNCTNSTGCSRKFIKLKTTITTPPNWSFKKWENIAPPSPPTLPACPCAPNDATCTLTADTLQFAEEVANLQCAAVFHFTPPACLDTGATCTPGGTPVCCGNGVCNGTCRPQCFTAGTKITMADGTKKSIEDIQPNDTVKSLDTNGKWSASTVEKTLKNTSPVHLKVVTTIGTVHATPTHPFYIGLDLNNGADNQYKPLSDFMVGDYLIVDHHGTLVRTKILSIEEIAEEVPVFNLHNGSGPHTFVADDFIVHNK